MVTYLERGADAYGPADNTHSLSLASVKSRFVLRLVPAHPGSREQRAVKRVHVCVCVLGKHCSAWFMLVQYVQ